MGYRLVHHDNILNDDHPIEWFEGLTDNYLDLGSTQTYKLQEIGERYPLVLHSVGMSLGAPEPLDKDYMNRLKKLKKIVNPEWMSDHMCWSSWGNAHHHDLLPLPYTAEAVLRIAKKIKRAQEILETRIAIENLSSYVSYTSSTMTEPQFLRAVAEEADCWLLLDVNNIVVSAKNHKFDPVTYLMQIPSERIKQIHLAGYTDCGSYYLDTHGDYVFPNVWDLYRTTIGMFGPIPTMMEWDNDIPAYEVVVGEMCKAKAVMDTFAETRSTQLA
jgi:uncharacterized protein (UPF0276 family)